MNNWIGSTFCCTNISLHSCIVGRSMMIKIGFLDQNNVWRPSTMLVNYEPRSFFSLADAEIELYPKII